jgi:hypothetical protein
MEEVFFNVLPSMESENQNFIELSKVIFEVCSHKIARSHSRKIDSKIKIPKKSFSHISQSKIAVFFLQKNKKKEISYIQSQKKIQQYQRSCTA